MPLQALQTAHCTARFNRYMVECECYKGRTSNSKRCVLIDTWWNVNFAICRDSLSIKEF